MTKARNRNGSAARRRKGWGWTTVTALAIAAVATGGIYWLTAGAGQSRPVPRIATPGSLEAPGAFHNFGRVSMGAGKVTHTYELVNRGEAPALVRRLFTSCMCTEATLVDGTAEFGPFGMEGHTYVPDVNQVVPPGGRVQVRATFDPNAHGPAGIGRNDRAIAVLIGDGTKLDLQFTAYVTP